MTSCTKYGVWYVIFDDVWDITDEIVWSSLQGFLKFWKHCTKYSRLSFKSQVVYALVLDTVSLRDVPTGKRQVGLNVVTKFRWIREPPCISKYERWKSPYPTLRHDGCVWPWRNRSHEIWSNFSDLPLQSLTYVMSFILGPWGLQYRLSKCRDLRLSWIAAWRLPSLCSCPAVIILGPPSSGRAFRINGKSGQLHKAETLHETVYNNNNNNKVL
jgi:hypothetical protein